MDNRYVHDVIATGTTKYLSLQPKSLDGPTFCQRCAKDRIEMIALPIDPQCLG